MTDLFQERKNKIKTFKEDLVLLEYKTNKAPDKIINIPDNIFRSCSSCNEAIVLDELRENLCVCPNCGFHHPLRNSERIKQISDSYKECYSDLELKNFDFEGYEEKYRKNQEYAKLKDAVSCYIAQIKDVSFAVAIMDSHFMMGSMGYVVGEKITLLCEDAIKKKLPLIIFCASGGARMQEGIISLMQMAKTSAAIAKLKEAGLLYISVLTYPTTGGVSASFASLGDITIAEPQALIGFAGKRVIENTIKETLPKEFQTAEFLLEKGFLDLIVERKNLKDMLYKLLKLHRY